MSRGWARKTNFLGSQVFMHHSGWKTTILLRGAQRKGALGKAIPSQHFPNPGETAGRKQTGGGTYRWQGNI